MWSPRCRSPQPPAEGGVCPQDPALPWPQCPDGRPLAPVRDAAHTSLWVHVFPQEVAEWSRLSPFPVGGERPGQGQPCCVCGRGLQASGSPCCRPGQDPSRPPGRLAVVSALFWAAVSCGHLLSRHHCQEATFGALLQHEGRSLSPGLPPSSLSLQLFGEKWRT